MQIKSYLRYCGAFYKLIYILLNITYARDTDEILVYTSTLSEFIEIELGFQITHRYISFK